MALKITTLIENTPDDIGELYNEHGLSLYIEVDDLKILFDTGQSGKFVENAYALHKDLNALDYILFSHGHYDHTGGFETLVKEINKYPEVILGDHFFEPKYKCNSKREYHFIGNSFDESYIQKKEIAIRIMEEDMLSLSKNVIVLKNFNRITDYETPNKNLLLKQGDSFRMDEFQDEISLGILTKRGIVVVVGCSHVGIINILNTIQTRLHRPIYAVIGGTHLVDADERRIEKTIEAFNDMKIELLAISHCTGEKGKQLLEDSFKYEFIVNNTGNCITIQE